MTYVNPFTNSINLYIESTPLEPLSTYMSEKNAQFYPTSKFKKTNTDNLVIESIGYDKNYCRTTCKNRTLLEQKLLKLYGFNSNSDFDALIFPSGLSAISTIMNWICKSKK